jgi:hypothetical protein
LRWSLFPSLIDYIWAFLFCCTSSVRSCFLSQVAGQFVELRLFSVL